MSKPWQPGRPWRGWPLLLGLLGLLSASGCLPLQPGSPLGTPQLTLRIDSPPDANEGLPFYVVVRVVDAPGFVGEGYDTIARQVTHPDASVLASAVLFPGSPLVLQLPRPEDPVGVYCLFTRAEAPWKTLLGPPNPRTVRLVLGKHAIEQQKVVMPLWRFGSPFASGTLKALEPPEMPPVPSMPELPALPSKPNF